MKLDELTLLIQDRKDIGYRLEDLNNMIDNLSDETQNILIYSKRVRGYQEGNISDMLECIEELKDVLSGASTESQAFKVEPKQLKGVCFDNLTSTLSVGEDYRDGEWVYDTYFCAYSDCKGSKSYVDNKTKEYKASIVSLEEELKRVNDKLEEFGVVF